MSELAVIDQETGELLEPRASVNLFGVTDPVEVVDSASKIASALAAVIQDKQLFTQIGQKQHVHVEAWTLLGSMLGVYPVIVWSRPVEGGWEARCEAVTRSGEIVGSAEAMCTHDERNWGARPEHALRAMAQTRARSKALSGPLGFVVTLAGYSATPAEEMPPPEPSPRAQAEPSVTERKVTQAQQAKIAVLLKELEERSPTAEGQKSWQVQAREEAGVRSRAELSVERAGWLIEWLEMQSEAAGIPF